MQPGQIERKSPTVLFVEAEFSVSSEELTQRINDIPTLKQVLIVDACHSGQIVEHVVLLNQNTFLDDLNLAERLERAFRDKKQPVRLEVAPTQDAGALADNIFRAVIEALKE